MVKVDNTKNLRSYVGAPSTFGRLSRFALNSHFSNRQFTTSELIGRRKKNMDNIYFEKTLEAIYYRIVNGFLEDMQ